MLIPEDHRPARRRPAAAAGRGRPAGQPAGRQPRPRPPAAAAQRRLRRACWGTSTARPSSSSQLLHDAAPHPEFDSRQLHDAMEHMAGAITALQFQDLAVAADRTTPARGCATAPTGWPATRSATTRTARRVVEDAPLRPNPVTQDEMDAGSIELF
ncbi:MAG: hypothetical protein MZW92_22865 [Comamonadaceae bacterium]|nr:hypothetical protein [Comamonadaceae bacterium]